MAKINKEHAKQLYDTGLKAGRELSKVLVSDFKIDHKMIPTIDELRMLFGGAVSGIITETTGTTIGKDKESIQQRIQFLYDIAIPLLTANLSATCSAIDETKDMIECQKTD